MKQVSLKQMSVEELAMRFLALTLAQDKALHDEDNPKYNVHFQEMMSVVDELKSRTTDRRHALTRFLKHPNPQVRLMTALATLSVGLAQARAVLQNISDGNIYPQAIDARGMLRALDEGHIPT